MHDPRRVPASAGLGNQVGKGVQAGRVPVQFALDHLVKDLAESLTGLSRPFGKGGPHRIAGFIERKNRIDRLVAIGDTAIDHPVRHPDRLEDS